MSNKVKKAPATVQGVSFLDFMRAREQWVSLAVLAALFAVVGVVFHAAYPVPFIFHDSYTYVNAAITGIFDIYRPNGYPRWLAFLYGISPTLGFLYWVHFVLYALASMLLLFSAKFIFGIRRAWLFWLMALCAVLSPRLVLSTNYLMSDGIFAILAALLMTACLWMVRGRSWVWAAVSMVAMWLMCKLRYSGLFFAPVLMVAFFISFKDFKFKLAPWLMACVPLAVALLFYSSAKKEYVAQTHVDVFSGFGGWQKINNAMVLLPDAKELAPADFDGNAVKGLHKFMQSLPDSLFDAKYALQTNYMWSNSLPLKQYVFSQCQSTGKPYPHQWVASSVVFADYADQLVAHYPGRYLTRYFFPSLWSNTAFQPFVEETMPVKDKELFSKYYGTDFEVYHHPHHFFTAIDPARRIAQAVYWIVALLAAVWFFATMRKHCFADRRWLCLFVMLIAFIVFIGAQAVSSPNTTWRYTMPFYQASIVFIFALLDRLLPARKK